MRLYVPAVVALLSACPPPLLAQTSQSPAAEPPASDDVPLLRSPDADTIAWIDGDSSPRIVETDGDWVRIRLEGWMERDAAAKIGATEDDSARRITLAALRTDPTAYVGATVHWDAQFVAIQHADSLRSDMRTGEAYLLLRDPGGESGFVYAVVPPELADETATLMPLQRIKLIARIRAGRSRLTGHPVIELIEISPSTPRDPRE